MSIIFPSIIWSSPVLCYPMLSFCLLMILITNLLLISLQPLTLLSLLFPLMLLQQDLAPHLFLPFILHQAIFLHLLFQYHSEDQLDLPNLIICRIICVHPSQQPEDVLPIHNPYLLLLHIGAIWSSFLLYLLLINNIFISLIICMSPCLSSHLA